MKKLILEPKREHYFDIIDNDERSTIGMIVPTPFDLPDDLPEGLKSFSSLEIHTGGEVIISSKSLDCSLRTAFGKDVLFRFAADPLLTASENLIMIDFIDTSKESFIIHSPSYLASQLVFNEYLMHHQERRIEAVHWISHLYFSLWKHQSHMRRTCVPMSFRRWSMTNGIINNAYGKYMPLIPEEHKTVIDLTQTFMTQVLNKEQKKEYENIFS